MTTATFYAWDSVDQTAATGVEDVQVRLYSDDGSTFITYGTTDSSGEFTTDVPDATYWVRFFKTGYAFASKLYVEVDAAQASNTFDVEAENLEELPPSAANNLCRVSGYAVDAGGQPRKGATFQFMLSQVRHIVSGRPITAAKVISRSDEYGYLEVELIQNAFYEVVVEGLDDQVFMAQVPELQSCNLTELIWPYPARVDLSSSSVAVASGDDEDVTVTLVLSSGVEMPLPDDAPAGAVSFTVAPESSDTDVATVSLSDSTLTITGVAAGSCTVTFTSSESYEERFPEISLSFDSISVTVT